MERRYEPPTPEDFAACEVPRNLPEEIQKHFREREGSRGSLEVDILVCRVQAKIDRRIGSEERLVVIRYVNADKIQRDYYLTNADGSVTLEEYAKSFEVGIRDRGGLPSRQERGGLGGLSTKLVRPASSCDAVVGDESVLDAGGICSKKSIPEMTVPQVHSLLSSRLELNGKRAIRSLRQGRQAAG